MGVPKKRRLRILVSNDDGIDAPGIEAVVRELKKLGDVDVVAPDKQRSAVGHAITMNYPLLSLARNEVLQEWRLLRICRRGHAGRFSKARHQLAPQGEARPPGFGDQPRLEHSNQHHLFRHRLGSNRGDCARDSFDRRLPDHLWRTRFPVRRTIHENSCSIRRQEGAAARNTAQRQYSCRKKEGDPGCRNHPAGENALG